MAVPATAGRLTAARVDGWLHELGIEPVERAERERTTSWDLVVDGRRRRNVRVTLILDPALALVAWVHFAPALNDSFRKSYRQFLHWNDEFPFVKFSLAADERPVLSTELPVDAVDLDALGVALARLLAICDLLLEESVHWLWPGARQPPRAEGPARNTALFDRYGRHLGELASGG